MLPPARPVTGLDTRGGGHRQRQRDLLMRELGLTAYEELHAWSVRQREQYWAWVVQRLGIHLQRNYGTLLDLTHGSEQPRWLVGAQLNIVRVVFAPQPSRRPSCFKRPTDRCRP